MLIYKCTSLLLVVNSFSLILYELMLITSIWNVKNIEVYTTVRRISKIKKKKYKKIYF